MKLDKDNPYKYVYLQAKYQPFAIFSIDVIAYFAATHATMSPLHLFVILEMVRITLVVWKMGLVGDFA